MSPGGAKPICEAGRRFFVDARCTSPQEIPIMFERRTLFVLGAGSSAELSFPVGSQLALNISERLRFVESNLNADRALYSDIQQTMPRQVRDYFGAAQRISQGIILSNSIDEFLDVHKDDPVMVHLGKAAIVRSILQAERKSKLFSNMAESTPFDMANVADSWFVLFMRALSSGLRIDNVRALAHNVSFVVFNYDRCLEQFLFKAIQQLYAISAQEADRILDTFSIHHPYGVVAPLRTTVDLNGRIPFGGLAESGDKYLLLAQSIKTFTEQLSDPESERRIKQAMEEAECIVFLGFGFHPANLTLLNPERTMAQRPVFATAYGMSESDVNSVFNAVDSMYEKIPRIGSLQNPFIVIDNTAKCLDLFQNYSRAIRGI